MKTTQIPIRATRAEARALLEAAHAVEYRESIMGATVQARCGCGWRSSWLRFGFAAQKAAERHTAALVEYPLEQRRRYAIYRDIGERWTIQDRENGDLYGPLGVDGLAGCLATLEVILADQNGEPTA